MIKEKSYTPSKESLEAILNGPKATFGIQFPSDPRPYADCHAVWLGNNGRTNKKWQTVINIETGEVQNIVYNVPLDEWLPTICPYAKGSIAWVRESFAMRTDFSYKDDPDKALHYAHYKQSYKGSLDDEWHYYGKWRSSTQIPRQLSRLDLLIMDVRVISYDHSLWDQRDGDFYMSRSTYFWQVDFEVHNRQEALWN